MIKKGITRPNILATIDGFTGANNARVSLAQVGHTADVAFEMHCRGDVSVWVISSDSRVMDSKLTTMKVTSLMSHLPLANSPPLVVKEVDSTLRSNIGAKIGALMKAYGMTGIVVAPVSPQARRTIMAGECWVDGVWMTETELANNPKTPVLSARTADIIRLQTAIPCQPVTVSQLSHLSYEQLWISVIDAQTDSGLDHIVAVVIQAKQSLLPVDSAGIHDATVQRSTTMPPPTVLAIIGSVSEVVQRQITTLHSHPYITQIYVDVEHILAGNISDHDARIVQTLQKGDHCIVHACNDSVVRHQIDILHQRWQMSHAAFGEKICRSLDELTR